MERQSAEYWIKHLHLVEHPGEEDGYFSVPFEDTFKVTSAGKVKIILYKLTIFNIRPLIFIFSLADQEQRSAAS